jgi:protease I
MERKILIVTGDGGECYEVLYAYHRFQEAGYVPVIAAPSKKLLNLVIHDFEEGWDTYVERPGYRRQADITINDAKAKDYEAVLLIGGRAPEYLRNDQKLLQLIRDFDAQGKWVFAICHGIQVYAATGLAKGLNMTCYEHVKCELEAHGGTFIRKDCVVDGRVVSAQTWQDHPPFFRAVFNALGGDADEAKLETVGASAKR